MRLLRLAAAVLLLIAATVQPTPAMAKKVCRNDCVGDEDTGDGGGGGLPGNNPPAQRQAYCPADSEWPKFHLSYLGDYLLSDGTEVFAGVGTPIGDPPPVMYGGEIAVAQQMSQWCSGPTGNTKQITYWLAFVTPDTVAWATNLVARVQKQLPKPTVEFLDPDIEHGWLYVRLNHHVGIVPPGVIEASARDGNPLSGYAHAWVRAVPVSLTFEMPASYGGEGLGACDLVVAQSEVGCEIRFTHASSITDDGWFHGTVTLVWKVESNSGKYNGAGPFTTTSDFKVQVAEVMAVGGAGG